MPSINQIKFLQDNSKDLKEPIAIIGSKEYDFDSFSFIEELNKIDLFDIIGLDIQVGHNVDVVLDICDLKNKYYDDYKNYFNTVICMQTLYAVSNPFIAAENIQNLMNDNAVLIFSDVFTHRIHRIPTDNWRFTYDGHKILFNNLDFDDSKTKIGITRNNKLIDFKYPFPELLKYYKEPNESLISFFSRKIIRKYFFSELLNLPRLMPEISIFSFARKNKIL